MCAFLRSDYTVLQSELGVEKQVYQYPSWVQNTLWQKLLHREAVVVLRVDFWGWFSTTVLITELSQGGFALIKNCNRYP